MRKVLFSVLALAFFCGSAMAAGSAVNVKGGFDLSGNVNFTEDDAGSLDIGKGFSFAGEYLFKVNDTFKVGGGLEYLMQRGVKDPTNKFPVPANIKFIPFYMSAEITPLETSALYLKGNLGYNVSFECYVPDNYMVGAPYKIEEKGGVYFGLGAGYEFESGLILEAMYSYYSGTLDFVPYNPWDPKMEVGVNYNRISLNLGYRFSF